MSDILRTGNKISDSELDIFPISSVSWDGSRESEPAKRFFNEWNVICCHVNGVWFEREGAVTA